MMPVALTIIGDLILLKASKVLGLNSSAWGLVVFDSSLKTISWHWIFYQCADRNSINYFDLAIFK